METLEKDLRDNIIRVLHVLVWLCLGSDCMFFLFFFATGQLGQSVTYYVLKRLCLPFAANVVIYQIARYFYQAKQHSAAICNMVCSVALCSMAGTMAVFHSYYTPIWCAPGLALMFCSVFHDKLIHWVLLCYSCVLVVLAALYVTLEHPEDFEFYLEHCVVVLIITQIFGMLARTLQKYQSRMESVARTSIENEEIFRKKLETDPLTGVHSRSYLMDAVGRTFGNERSTESVGLAIIDLDNFKRVNDTYGHDNGDKVLRTLGNVLKLCSNERMEVGRYGGEEFVIIFQGGYQWEYAHILDDLRERFFACSFDFMEEHVSFSAGLVLCNASTLYENAFHRADKSLYESKKAGKNQITVTQI